MIKGINILIVVILFFVTRTGAQDRKTANPPKVTDVWVVFKTHFDLGFTDLPQNAFSSVIAQK